MDKKIAERIQKDIPIALDPVTTSTWEGVFKSSNSLFDFFFFEFKTLK